MTVIMAAAFRDGMVITADTLLHDPETMRPVQNSAKTMVVGGRIGIAQAGAFSGTADVWRELEKTDLTGVTPEKVADSSSQTRLGAMHGGPGRSLPAPVRHLPSAIRWRRVEFPRCIFCEDRALGEDATEATAMSDVTDNKAKSRYELDVDGETAFAVYKRAGDVLILPHTEVPADLEGKGIGSRLIMAVIDDARSRGLKIRPDCPFVAAYVERHPETQDLVIEA